MIKGNPYRVVLFDDPLTPGLASRTGGYYRETPNGVFHQILSNTKKAEFSSPFL
jgi:hypothetical protein